jgi:uncharacterized protein YutE (UPF0331/DUF86 family)
MQLVRAQGLGLPQQGRDAFLLLARDGGLPADLADRLVRMVGFRNLAVHDYQNVAVHDYQNVAVHDYQNVAVHDYQALHLEVVRAIVEERLGDFEAFTAWALGRA